MRLVSTSFFLLFLLLSACTNSSERPEVQNPTVKTPTIAEQKFMLKSLLEKVNVSLEFISQKEFENIADPEAAFQKVRTLCEQSEGYSEDIWEGLNECSWAVEKERIKKHQDIVSRDGDKLVLKMNKYPLSLEHNPDAPRGATYYQFKTYIPSSNYFLIEEMVSEKCTRSKLVNSITNNQYNVTGSVVPSKNGTQFISYFKGANSPSKCTPKIELFEIGAEGLIKKWHFPINNKSIGNAKFPSENELYLSILSKTKPSEDIKYVKLSWP